MTEPLTDDQRAAERELARRARIRLRLAQHLSAITDLYEDLEAEALNRYDDHELPGGDAMVMLGPSANMSEWQANVDAAEAYYFEAVADGRKASWPAVEDNDADPAPPLLVLASWSDIVRDARDQPTALRATINREADYLRGSIDWMLDTPFLAVDALGRDLAKLRTRMESLLRAGHRDQFADEDVVCLKCASLLRRRMLDDGYEDHWWCYGCYRHLSPTEFYLAAAEAARLELQFPAQEEL